MQRLKAWIGRGIVACLNATDPSLLERDQATRDAAFVALKRADKSKLAVNELRNENVDMRRAIHDHDKALCGDRGAKIAAQCRAQERLDAGRIDARHGRLRNVDKNGQVVS